MLQIEYCRRRQQRLLSVCQQKGLDAIVVGLPQHVYYLSGHQHFWQHHPAFILFADDRSVLVSANQQDWYVAADDVRSYPANAMGTLRQEQLAEVSTIITQALAHNRAKRIGIDASLPSSQIALAMPGACRSIDSDLWHLRRQKDPDELLLMRHAISCCVAMYDRARELIEPGVSELHVFGELHTAAVKQAGEPLTALLGNDYACGTASGSARRDSVAQDGEIYILDLGPCFRGYFADNCRAFAVNRKPTDAQYNGWDVLAGVFPIIERLARPGVKCRELVATVNEYYRSRCGRNLPHHLGHGVGLQPHEYPHLNLHWDDTLLEGEVFTVEPGMYSPELAGGIRLENNYLVTPTGVEELLNYPLDL